MKKILLITLAVIMVISVFAACAKPETPEPSSTVFGNDDNEEEVPTQEPQLSEEPSQDMTIPENFSPTTGLTDTTTIYKPVIVQIDNEPGGRPQTNIQLADVVYETPIEGSDTRLTCVFNDVINSDNAPDKLTVGPVRSSRYYHQLIQGEWDALYVHMGGPDKTANPESDIWGKNGKHVKQRINGAGKGASNADKFYALRDGQSVSNYAAVDVVDAVKIYNYEPKVREPFKFYPLESYADEKTIDTIKLTFLAKLGFVEYKYDEATNKLTRYMNGKEFNDQATGNAIEAQNLVVQYTNAAIMPNDDPRREVGIIGSGPAEFVINGKHLKGKWSRDSVSSATKYTLEDGTEVTFAPGNTWIAVHPNNKSIEVTYADGTTSKSN